MTLLLTVVKFNNGKKQNNLLQYPLQLNTKKLV